jgi:hypothetical protein
VLLANGGVLAQGLPDHVLTDANLIDAYGIKSCEAVTTVCRSCCRGRLPDQLEHRPND